MHVGLEAQKLSSDIRDATDFVRSRTDLVPEVALILGSGLGPLANEIEDAVVIPYAEIPGITPSTAPGHAGEPCRAAP